MKRIFLSVALALGLLSVPVAATAIERSAAPAGETSALGGNTDLLFLAGIGVVVAAILLLPDDKSNPVSA